MVSILTLNSCSDFEEINTNPNAATKASSSMLATTLILDITKNEFSNLGAMMHDKSLIRMEFPEDEQYNYLGRASFDDLTVLNNVEKMIELAPENLKGTYEAVGRTIRANKFFWLSMRLGDIPYAEALLGEQGLTNPTYSTQKEVMVGVLNELETADQLFANGVDFEGDPIYNGDVSKWRKFVNTFELQVLLHLYLKEGDSDLKVKERFSNIVNNKPIFESNNDNFQLEYSDLAGQRYPFYKLGNTNRLYTMMSNVMVDKLKDLNDYRMFYYMDPSPVQIEAGADPSSWDSYLGYDPSTVYADLTVIFAGKDYSNFNSRYLELANAEPIYLISYSMLNFFLAEGALRGWISGSANAYYQEGIKASMTFTAGYTPDDALFHHDRVMTTEYIDSYIASDKVKLKTGADFETQLEQIITQRYLSRFMYHAPYDGFFEHRRTGYPEFPLNPSSNLNIPNDRFPIRWIYPQKELDYNTENVKSAIQSQYGGDDDYNETMWILAK
ncbi:SusD/RagB family nutrient-binding outer membrane lipoprotein [Marinilongibacter aquaticus]|uniref:SusD/RagB family nutrient-binding outer membrane lipoprotein n=1 Tax=Marinilongibacter aquaticus TaxID=2975157 RepID=UPI0021BDD896|nr:SusD/RagB family nutrient-binding outer membrane lipoprotein [Marinilongibacter aquaticus]UBM60719.1 SusD/RagB family nutrient-binding outer membrane lipoprotein [Marinilongibacter aquaticus]